MSLFKNLLETLTQRGAEELFELASNKIAFIAKKQGAEIFAALEHDSSAMAIELTKGERQRALKKQYPGEEWKLAAAEEAVTELAKASEKHLQWVVNKYVKLEGGKIQFRLEDVAERVKDAIDQFEDDRKKLKKKDLMQYKTFVELEDVLGSEDFDDEPEGSEHVITPVEQSFIDKKEVEVVHRGDGVRVYIPKTYEASKYFGRGTKWCTASKKTAAQFEHYSKSSPLYIVYAKGKKYQLHFTSKQFMDARDRPADVAELFSSFPILYKLFEKQAAKAGLVSMMRDDVSDETLKAAIDKHHKDHADFGALMRDLSSNKLNRVKQDIAAWMNAEHVVSRKKDAKNNYREGVRKFFTPFRGYGHDYRATHKKLEKVYTSDEMLALLKSFWGTPSVLLNEASDELLGYAVKPKENGNKLRDEFTQELLGDRNGYGHRYGDWIVQAEILQKLGYPLEQDKLKEIMIKQLEGYDAEKYVKLAIEKLNIQIDEPTQLKMIEKRPSIINSFKDPSNKIKERARMFAKRDNESGWRR